MRQNQTGIKFSETYYINEEKQTVVCKVRAKGYSGEWVAKAKCAPEDVFDVKTGKRIAALRARIKAVDGLAKRYYASLRIPMTVAQKLGIYAENLEEELGDIFKRGIAVNQTDVNGVWVSAKKPMIYLDNAATTKISLEVLAAMQPYLEEQYGNPGSIYGLGRTAKEAVEKARVQVARIFNCEPENIIFTSGGTEANNLVLQSIAQIQKPHIITSAYEHHSVLGTIETIKRKNRRSSVTYLRPNEYGVISPEDVAVSINERTAMVSVMYVNNEIGGFNDVSAIAAICDGSGVLFHSDCVQALGEMSLDMSSRGFDFASISAHKIHGPKGVGALYVSDKKLLRPLILGGSEQEFGLRGGTENVAGIVGFGKACEMFVEGESCLSYIQNLKRNFLSELIFGVNDNEFLYAPERVGVYTNGPLQSESGKIVNIRIDGVSGETLVMMMDSMGVCISSGSACTAHEDTPSHVLKAMGLSDDEARNSVRVSFSKYNTIEEVRRAAQIMAQCIRILRGGEL